MEDQIPEILYHYCSLDTFVKIIQNKTLRLSEIAKSNDSMECRWLERVVIPNLIRKTLGERLDRSEIDTARHEEIINEAINSFEIFYRNDQDIFQQRMILAICFSKEADLLSQWRGYANDGQGVAIGFNSEIFKNLKISHSEITLVLRKVLYNQDEQENSVKRAISMYIESFVDETQYQKRNYVLLAALVRSTLDSAFIKNEAFIEEAEWRLAANFIKVTDYKSIQKALKTLRKEDLLTDISISTSQDKLVYYGDLKYENLKQTKGGTLIRDIVLGPKCKASKRDVEILLGCSNFDITKIDIRKSKATYV